ncbi:DAHL domain-containing protein [Duganella sp. LjRoot269]|jgi:signal transduction histidine kinase|uniref:DAHL domain-containing protein n=1 Tax=Duganella sp. LjRoot269 TaxID=3342305 RepID=UPI003ECE7EF9
MKLPPHWRTRLALPAAILLLAGLLLGLYLRTRHDDATSYFANIAQLRQIRQLDAQWELDALKSKAGLNQNYDALVDPLHDMGELPQQLDGLAREAPDGALASAVAAYRKALRDKSALMEAFKSHNAVLRNSLAFLPVAVDDIGAMINAHHGRRMVAMGQAEAAANRVLLATLMYNEMPSEQELAEAQAELAGLNAVKASLSTDLKEQIDLLAAHARTVLREQAIVARLLGDIAATPTAARIDAISGLLGEAQQQALRRLQTNRLYLTLLAVTLGGLLSWMALRLIRTHATIKRVNAELQQANDHLEGRVQERTVELLQANGRLQQEMAERKALQSRLVQSEKLASIGQLAAGVAHEINNPLSFLASNFSTLEHYLDSLFEMLRAYEEAESSVASQEMAAHLSDTRNRIDLAYLKEDIPVLVAESRGGMNRVGKIVQDLKEFSNVELDQQWVWADLRAGLESTLNVLAAELRQVAEVRTEFGPMLEIECLPAQLNLVFMNLLQNAMQALEPQARPGRITVRTGGEGRQVWVEIADNGCGIAADVLPRIFDPFFTTRPIGKGTGLGLSLSYGIVRNHRGRIDVRSAPGEGSTFRVTLPINHHMAEA